MGVDGLAYVIRKQPTGSTGGKPACDPTKDLENTWVAVDLSVILVPIVQNIRVVEEQQRRPPVSALSVQTTLDDWYNGCQFKERNMTIVCTLDGRRFKLKEDWARIKRNATKAKAKQELEDILADKEGTAASRLKSVKRQLCTVDSDVLAHVLAWRDAHSNKEDILIIGAPFEADQQCVSLEMQGLVDGIITRDGDLYVYGAKVLFFCGQSLAAMRSLPAVVRQGKTLDKHLNKLDLECLRYVGALAGSDFAPRVHGCTIAASSVLALELQAARRAGAGEFDKLLNKLEKKKKWPSVGKNNPALFSNTTDKPVHAIGLVKRFKLVAANFEFALVFKVATTAAAPSSPAAIATPPRRRSSRTKDAASSSSSGSSASSTTRRPTLAVVPTAAVPSPPPSRAEFKAGRYSVRLSSLNPLPAGTTLNSLLPNVYPDLSAITPGEHLRHAKMEVRVTCDVTLSVCLLLF